ncbi:LptF/LptG family permease [Robertkochia aurantiaca]|uniref:LptF/LptG family permease n=1 Tax=Robertkochia aurantiaca TaxID=2873700 RepID=UPI001CC9296C|nr:LptF/LptG family permease [Robertkochia sp. 3YJGBD-33]
MYILDRYILSRFLYNFISSFVILMLIFIFQAIWFFIDEWAGKGIDLAIVGKFLLYFSPNLVPNVLPLTVLLASIMTFGSLAENYEFAAMKASGISLFRAMRSLIIFITLLSIGTFFFANNVIPAAELKSYNLRRNIAQLKPALAITEGIFNNMPETDLNIKVDKKYGENDKMLDNVIIHKLSAGGKNNQVIKSKSGELVSSEDSDILQLVLREGNYFEDIESRDRDTRDDYPFAKAEFDAYTMYVDLSQVNNVDLEQENISNTHKMLKAREILSALDTLYEENKMVFKNFGESVYLRSGAANLKAAEKVEIKDTVNGKNFPTDSLLNLYVGWRQTQIIESAINKVKSSQQSIEGKKGDLNRRVRLINHHILAFHNKYSLPIACFILFFVGAPLGAIIRKGGLGLPMVLAIGLFLAYYFIGIFVKNYAEDGSFPPAIAAWISTLIMLPLGIWFTRRATADKAVFDPDSMTQRIGSWFKIFRKKDRTPAK